MIVGAVLCSSRLLVKRKLNTYQENIEPGRMGCYVASNYVSMRTNTCKQDVNCKLFISQIVLSVRKPLPLRYLFVLVGEKNLL